MMTRSLPSTVATLDPACFSIVMATGIVSLACWYHGTAGSWWHCIAILLLWANVLTFSLLTGLTIVRISTYFRRVINDLQDPRRSFGAFSMVAASCVLGSQLLSIAQMPMAAIALWCCGIVGWFLLTYGIFYSLTLQKSKPNLRDGVHGGWLLAVVAAQAVSLLGSLLSAQFSSSRDLVLFFSLTMWLAAGMLYVWIIVFVFYRYCFEPVDVDSMTPPYWINMGAMAISTLAGCSLMEASASSDAMLQFVPFLKGGALLCWATATWWIPLLIAFGIWRHAGNRVPFKYDLSYWSMVFPLGMYCVATHAASQCFELRFLEPVSSVFMYVALAAWTMTGVGMATDQPAVNE
ncbi:tellurite resistance/C4-dicarboxylate transporter family protein [Aureliella helgolandensis]|nr:tellurite resistance/C4-dicarboxylate transporter family protein [Aureliella helgolandensis]